MMLTAEMMLSDEYSSVLELGGAEEEMERTARDLADAVDALPMDRSPVGWNEAPAVAGNIRVARGAVRQGCPPAVPECPVRRSESADADAEAEYADEQLALAARNLCGGRSGSEGAAVVNRNVGLTRTPFPRKPGGSWGRTVPLESGRITASRAGIFPAAETGASPRTKNAATRSTGPSRKVRLLVLERDGHACVCCGRSVIGQPYSLQHRKRRSQGGTNSPSNLVTVLGTGTTGHHERIDSRIDPEDEAKGYTVRSWDDPALIPVMVFSEHRAPGRSAVALG